MADFDAEDRAIAAINIVSASELFEDEREAAKSIIAAVLRSPNAWGVMEDVIVTLIQRDRQ